MRRGRFCEISKPHRNGFVRCGHACDKLAQARARRAAGGNYSAAGGSSALQNAGSLLKHAADIGAGAL